MNQDSTHNLYFTGEDIDRNDSGIPALPKTLSVGGFLDLPYTHAATPATPPRESWMDKMADTYWTNRDYAYAMTVGFVFGAVMASAALFVAFNI